ncbi:MAG: glycosyltransferase family 39 protein [Anaerolineae bacterium]|nr:glycosyltransferase family 39 protein [Anaerolineae bacterium]
MIAEQTVERRVALPWLTVEVAAYGLIVALAGALRLGGLSIRIMDVPEAAQALGAWQLAQGGVPEASYSALLTSGQALLYALFGASDVAARLLPALAGSAMVLLPYWLRGHLGRAGALAASLAMAVSPTLIYSARYGDGATILIACALGAVVLWHAYRSDRRPAYLYAIAVLVGLWAIADPRAIGVALVLAAAWAVERYAFRRDPLALGGEHPVRWRRLLGVAAATAALGATALTMHPGGIATWADAPAAWAAHFGPVVNGQPWTYPLAALLLYEPLLVLFGAIGAVDLIAHKNAARTAIWTAGGALALALAAGGRDPGDVALVCAFLALPAGRAIGELVDSWTREGKRSREGLFLLIGLGITVYVALEASFYGFSLIRGLPQASQFLWFWLAAMLVVVVLVVLVWAWHGPSVTWRVGGAMLAVMLILGAFSAAVGLNYWHTDDPRELHVWVASDEGIRDALSVLDTVSYRRTGAPVSTPLTVEAAVGPIWRWYLRDWEDVRVVESLTAGVDTPLVLTSGDRREPVLGDRYIGQDFAVRTWWQARRMGGNEGLQWWLYRKSLTAPEVVQRVIVWMSVEEEA